MVSIKLVLEYDGTDFSGWQYQKNGRSVQEELERAIHKILQCDIRVAGGGRTDAGVHAHGQVASFQSEQEIDIILFKKGINAVLPEDIVLRDVQVMPQEFHARYSAKARKYRYIIHKEPTALQRKYCWQFYQDLDIIILKECSKMIIGEHEFQSFCKSGSTVKDYVCNVSTAVWNQDGHVLTFTIISNRFLYGMVRALVGTMVNAGRGYQTIENFREILESKSRANAGMAAPAHGLVLEEIVY
jgi:tRNA pseudouridine38-40 synthase